MWVDPSPGKKAKLFDYAKGLSPDVAESDSMGNRNSIYENEITINKSINYC